MDRMAPIDKREAELMEDIERQRLVLVERGEAFRRSAMEAFDPREKVRRHPIASLLASLGAGMGFGLLPVRRPQERPPETPSSRYDSPLTLLAASVLPGLLPKLVEPLFSFIGSIGSRFGPKESSRGGDGDPRRRHDGAPVPGRE